MRYGWFTTVMDKKDIKQGKIIQKNQTVQTNNYENIIRDRQIDYVSIIDSLNDRAFRCCVEYLHSVLSFMVLKKDDIRKIDLEEKILSNISPYLVRMNIDNHQSMAHYMSVLKLYLNTFIVCKKSSRASSYMDRINEIIDKVIYDDYCENDIDDIVTIFIGLFRGYRTGVLRYGKVKFNIITLSIENSPDDIEVISWIKENSELKPTSALRKKYMNRSMVTLTSDVIAEKRFMYITSVVLLCKLLQKTGYFEEGE